jgi:uncharacterized protein YukE
MPSGNPGQLEQLADALDQHASRVTDVAKATAAVTGLVRTDAEWTGQAADSYSQFTGEFTSRIGRVAPPLNQIATAVRGYATALRTAQQQVTAYNNIVESPEAASGQITPALLQAAYAAQDSANQACASCQAAGSEAAGQVKSATAQLTAVFKADSGDKDKDKDPAFEVVLEKIHTAMDASGIDGILWFIGKNADLAEKFMKALPKQEEDWLLDMMRADVNAKVANPEADIEELASQTTSRWLSMGDAAETFGEEFAQSTKMLGLLSRTGRLVGGPVAIAGDVLTMIHPSQSGTMGWVDRGDAGVNAAVVGADTAGAVGEALGVDALASLSLGPVGLGIAVGTGLYLAGSYLYAHDAWFRNDLAKPVGHFFVDVGEGTAHVAAKVYGGVVHYGGDVLNALGL